MHQSASYSIVIDRPASEVWAAVRDFDSYPRWVDGVDASHIEGGLPGTAVGCVRDFTVRGVRTRQRLVAHSDVERSFSYESCGPTVTTIAGAPRTMDRYRGTLQLRPISEGDRCFAEWSSTYQCSAADAESWRQWWAQSLPTWLGSLRRHLDRRLDDEPSA